MFTMKKYTTALFLIVLLFFIVFDFSSGLKADPPNPPVVPGSHGQGGNTGAPLDGMLGLLLVVLGSGYGGFMIYDKKKEKEEDQ